MYTYINYPPDNPHGTPQHPIDPNYGAGQVIFSTPETNGTFLLLLVALILCIAFSWRK